MELNKCSEIAQEKLTLTRRELQELVALTSRLTTQLGIMLTSKDDLLINSFGITKDRLQDRLRFWKQFRASYFVTTPKVFRK